MKVIERVSDMSIDEIIACSSTPDPEFDMIFKTNWKEANKGALEGLYYDESTDTLAIVHNGIVEAYSPKENFFVDNNTNGWFRMYMPPAAILGFQYIGGL